MGHEPDWRTAVFSNLANDLPPSASGHRQFPEGSPVVVVTLGTDKSGQRVGFPQPSAAAMALNVAAHASEAAMELQSSISLQIERLNGQPLKAVPAASTSDLFDFFEQCMITATFSVLSLEAYCNMTIDRSVKDSFPWRNRKGVLQEMTTLDLERNLSTEEKLGELLPSLLNMTSPKGKAVWQNFKLLKDKRNATTHVKSGDQSPRPRQISDAHKTSLFTGFIGETITDWPKAAVKMINYFDRRDVQWPWVQRELDRWGIPRNADN